MASPPSELSLMEIRKFMINNGCKVTNHALVKHFKFFLTNPTTQIEARKQFKTYVNILSVIRNEGDEKYLILKKKYINEMPAEDNDGNSSSSTHTPTPMSPGSQSLNSMVFDVEGSPLRQPPPYRPPPVVSPLATPFQTAAAPVLRSNPLHETKTQYKEVVNEFQTAVSGIMNMNQFIANNAGEPPAPPPPNLPPRKKTSVDSSSSEHSRKVSVNRSDSGPRGVDRPDSLPLQDDKENVAVDENGQEADNKISVKEAMMKFNRYASVEEAKMPLSPMGNKKPDRNLEENCIADQLHQHSKSKEWLLSAAKANYQDLAKLASEFPILVRMQDPNTTALHWAAKHGNEDIVKLIAGTYKGDVNARTNGGYTPLHIAMQFGKNDIFELLCNVYKADRDLCDWSGKKPLDYQKQMTSVSASTYSKIKARKKHSEKDLGFLRIGSLNVRVKKTTEAFSNFLGVGSNATRIPSNIRNTAPPTIYSSYDKIHKTWGSADNIPHDKIKMPPPKYGTSKKRRPKRDIDYDQREIQSMPSTPNQLRAPIGILCEEHTDGEQMAGSDSDTACGFDSNWHVVGTTGRTGNSGGNGGGMMKPTYL